VHRAVTHDLPGVFNAGGDGVLLLSQAIRRAGRIELPVPAPAVRAVGSLVRRTGLVDFSPEQLRFLSFGRVVDIERLRSQFPYTPKYSTAEAFSTFLSGRPITPVLPPERIRQAEQVVGQTLGVRRSAVTARG
jgi:UDP-glucose 4-epimerase